MALSDGNQIVLGFLCLAGVYVLTRMVVAKHMHKAGKSILADLKRKKALDAASAVELPYAKTDWLRFGLRDYRPKVLEGLVQCGVVVRTDQGRYYLARPELG